MQEIKIAHIVDSVYTPTVLGGGGWGKCSPGNDLDRRGWKLSVLGGWNRYKEGRAGENIAWNIWGNMEGDGVVRIIEENGHVD